MDVLVVLLAALTAEPVVMPVVELLVALVGVPMVGGVPAPAFPGESELPPPQAVSAAMMYASPREVILKRIQVPRRSMTKIPPVNY